MWKASQVTVTAATTEILPENTKRQSVILRNADATDTVTLSGEGQSLASGAGYSLLAGIVLNLGSASQFDRSVKSALYGIAPGGQTAVIEILENVSPSL